MEDKKDITKKVLNNGRYQDQSFLRVANYFGVQDHAQYLQLAHRSQKILTALYMITDFLEKDDPLRKMIREEMSLVTQTLFSLTHAPKKERVEKLSCVHNQLYSSLSYLSVVRENGFVSEMNYTIISHEIVLLCIDIDIQIKKSLPYDRKDDDNRTVAEFSFSESFFENYSIKDTNNKKDISDIKDTVKDLNKNGEDVSFMEKDTRTLRTKKVDDENNVLDKSINIKNQRQEDILKILKQKKDASINDICNLIKGCSSKTIQRDLILLIKKGLVRKSGDRRWSVYNLNY